MNGGVHIDIKGKGVRTSGGKKKTKRRRKSTVRVGRFTYRNWLHACKYIKPTAISLSTRTRWLLRIF